MPRKTEPRWLAQYCLAGQPEIQKTYIPNAATMNAAIRIMRERLWRLGKDAPKLFAIEEVE